MSATSSQKSLQHVLTIRDMECRYSDTPVVRGLSMDVYSNTMACLLGPSGSGKTTVLRTIAGFLELSHGEIRIADAVVSRPGFTLPPEQRQLGMVFQDNALFPHMSVARNIAAGLHKVRKAERKNIVGEMLERVGLNALANRYPHELSGGQQQRVAIARALAPKPALLLMDEPFSNLDLSLREKLGLEVRNLIKEYDATCLLVTHDQHDAFALGDLVGVMSDGQLNQWDTPYNLYHEPSTPFIADFIGDGVLIPGTMVAPDRVATELGVHESKRAYPFAKNTQVNVLVRPDDIVTDRGDHSVTVARKAFKGAQILYTLKLESGRSVLSLLPSHSNHGLGETIKIRLAADHLVAFLDTN